MIQKNQILGRSGLIARRLVATLIDLVLLTAIVGVCAMGIAWLKVRIAGMPSETALAIMFHNVAPERRELAWYQHIAATIAPYAMLALPLSWWIYDALFSWLGAHSTPGKWLACLKTEGKWGTRLYLGEAAMRTALKIATVVSLMFIGKPIVLGCVVVVLLAMPGLTFQGQFLHDFLTGTNVFARPTWTRWFARKAT